MKVLLFQPVDRIFVQVPRALVASILSALLDCLYMVFLVEICRWQPVAAAILSYLIGGILQYILCSVWVFPNAPGNKAVGFLSFTLLSLGGLAITWAVMAVGGKWLLPYGLSKFLALGLAFVWNFSSRKFLLFTKKAAADDVSLTKSDTPKDYAEWISTMKDVSAVRKTMPAHDVVWQG